MITTGNVTKAPQFTCDRCGLKAASPIVVSKANADRGVCSNVKACERRQHRNAVHKAATS